MCGASASPGTDHLNNFSGACDNGLAGDTFYVG